MMTKTLSKDVNPFDTHTTLVGVIATAKGSFVAMGRLLSQLRDDDRFLEAVGEGINTWDTYLQQPEIGLSRSEANRLIQIYEQFVVKLGLKENHVATIPLKNLHYLLPLAKEDNNDIYSLISDAEVLSQKDFKERIYDIKNDDGERSYEYVLMQRCIETGGLSKVHGATHKLIKDHLEQYIC